MLIVCWFTSAPLLLLSQAWPDSVCTITEYKPGEHAIWLSKLPTDTDTDYQFGPSGGVMTYFSDSSARITGRIYNRSDSTKQWDLTMWLVDRRDFSAWTALGRGTKNGGGTNTQSSWIFYELDSTRSSLTGVPGTFYAGDTLSLHHNPPSLQYGFQIGWGANDKNAHYGISGWFLFKGDYTGHGDINAKLDCQSLPPCVAAIDTAFAQCISDSTFEVVVSFSGNDTLYMLTDQLGNGPGLVPPGTYSFGTYPSGSIVSVQIVAANSDSCTARWDSLSAICEPVNVCDVIIEDAFAQCKTDSSFEIVVTFSGIGQSFAIYDDQGSAPIIVTQPGTYLVGEYFNSVEVLVFVEESELDSCVDVRGPLTADCTPVALCDLVLDTVFTECLTDSTFRVGVGFSGTGSQFQIFDNQGSQALLGLSAGTYWFGEYLHGTPVSLTILDFAIFNCFLSTPFVTDSCEGSSPSGNIWGNFQAEAVFSGVYLRWKSAQEPSLETYTIERSTDSLHYEIIHSEPGKGGEDTGLISYQYQDHDAQPDQTYYYRLCEVDLRGMRRFSPVRKVVPAPRRLGSIGSLYPQPAQDQSRLPVLSARAGAELEIMVVDGTGKIWLRRSQFLQMGEQEVLMNWEGLPPGIYFLRASIDAKETSAQRVLIWR